MKKKQGTAGEEAIGDKNVEEKARRNGEEKEKARGEKKGGGDKREQVCRGNSKNLFEPGRKVGIPRTEEEQQVVKGPQAKRPRYLARTLKKKRDRDWTEGDSNSRGRSESAMDCSKEKGCNMEKGDCGISLGGLIKKMKETGQSSPKVERVNIKMLR